MRQDENTGVTTPSPRVNVKEMPSQFWAVLAVLILVMARYYFWTIHSDPAAPIEDIGMYTRLTDALLHGQTSLRLRPPPELLALKDPYDPNQNAPYRLHDATLFNGRYYSYFGVAPVIFLYLPYALLSGRFLPDRVGTWLFAIGAYAMACLFLKLLLDRYWPRLPRWLFCFWCLCLGFSNTFPFLLRRPAMYETAIAAGQFFVLFALYCIARSSLGLGNPRVTAALAGLALAAAFGSRPQTVLACLALAWFWGMGPCVPNRERARRFLFASAPFVAGVALVLLYNYARFGSPLEFGTSYMLPGFDARKVRLFSTNRLLPNLWFSLLEPPRLQSRFPFVVLAPNPPFPIPKNLLRLEKVAGIAWLAPMTVLLLWAPGAWKRILSSLRREWLLCTGTLLVLGAAWICVDGIVMATMRYEADFATVLFVAAAVVLAGASESTVRIRRILFGAVVALGLLGVVINGAIGMTGYYDNFRKEAPKQYQSLANLFAPVEKLMVWCGVPSEQKPAAEVAVD